MMGLEHEVKKMDLCQIVTPEVDTTQALIAGIDNQMVAIPVPSIITIENIAVSDISLVDSEDVIYLREHVIPLVYLKELFKIGTETKSNETITVIVCAHNNSYVGLVVDKLFGQQDIEEKSLGVLANNQFISGASIISEDDVAMVLKVQSFIA